MINKIDVYNVKFGDCIYLHMKDRGVLTDCGSKSRSTLNRGRNKVLVDTMIEGIMISDPMRSLVVTHFHDDHYNLVDRFPNNSFDKVFVPDFFTRYHIRIQLYVLLMAPINSSIYRFAKEMLELIPNISIAADDDAMVWFVKKGDNIHGMEVLWPDPKENEVKRLANRLRDIFLDWAKDHTDSSSKYEVSDLIPGFVVQSERDGLFRDRIEKSVPLRLAAGDLEEFYKKALNIREDIEMPKEGLINGSLKREISQIQNSCSIVFHNTVGENTGLFLGDVDKNNFER
ncbi:MAG: hypothetical protein J6P98_03570, partial [Clostridia bacterium]|nr:hypothetical protein [Clostridia bacterium]